MFRRRDRDREAAEAAREADRRALFAKLAERPDHVCPFLGLAGERTGYLDGASDEHRCYAFGDPAPLSAEQQTRVCQERGYGNCPRYLRGVLVIPSEELHTLRRSAATASVAAASSSAGLAGGGAVPPARSARRRPSPVFGALVLLLVLAAGAGMAAWLAFGQDRGIATIVPSEEPSEAVRPTLEATPAPTVTPAATVTAVPTATPAASRTPDPTPLPADVFEFYEVQVNAGEYTLYNVDASGAVVTSRRGTFSDRSQAPVELVDAPNGQRHWRTVEGEYAGLSYVYPDSGGFEIWAVYRRPDGGRSSEPLPEEEL